MSTPTLFVPFRSPRANTKTAVADGVRSLDKYYSKGFTSRYFKKLKITR